MLGKKNTEFNSFDLNGKTILIADDEYSVRFYYQEVYSDTGATLILAKNGKEVIERYKSHPEIDIILMDMRMPECSGIEATIEILKINPNAIILIQSASVSSEDRDAAITAGCLDYIGKPINPEALIGVIRNHLK